MAPGVLDIDATHFSNTILLQIRLNGEMNCTLDVSQTGVRPMEESMFQRPIAGMTNDDDEDGDEDETLFIRDNLADYNVHVRLGDPNDSKLSVVATQIAELYHRVVIATLQRGSIRDPTSGLNLVITLSSKIFNPLTRDGTTSNNDEDFAKLVFVLKCIKDMYTQ